jgi:hypothetical protein
MRLPVRRHRKGSPERGPRASKGCCAWIQVNGSSPFGWAAVDSNHLSPRKAFARLSEVGRGPLRLTFARRAMA